MTHDPNPSAVSLKQTGSLEPTAPSQARLDRFNARRARSDELALCLDTNVFKYKFGKIPVIHDELIKLETTLSCSVKIPDIVIVEWLRQDLGKRPANEKVSPNIRGGNPRAALFGKLMEEKRILTLDVARVINNGTLKKVLGENGRDLLWKPYWERRKHQDQKHETRVYIQSLRDQMRLKDSCLDCSPIKKPCGARCRFPDYLVLMIAVENDAVLITDDGELARQADEIDHPALQWKELESIRTPP